MTFRYQYFLPLALCYIICLFSSCNNSSKHDTISLVPYPNALELLDGTFTHTNVSVEFNQSEGSAAIVELFIPKLEQYFKLESDKPNTVIKISQDKSLQDEAYNLTINTDQIELSAATDNGFIYGFTTLLQLLDQYAVDEVNIPCIQINDYPQYKWRGMHLDVSRHFFDVAFVKKMLDAMVLHKLNVFHWHLTDDQGWRIEIKKYPELTAKGAWREETMKNHLANHPIVFDGIKYGGFYTQEQIKDVVAYASNLGIMVVPEIEMPGHAVAAARAFPELTCTGNPQPFNEWGVSDDVFCAGKENTFSFLQDVIDEVVELFPAPYIHVGGDECPKDKWKECKKCQARIKREGLADELELQSYFIKRMEKYISAKGKKLIGWDEILEGGLAKGATVMSWRGVAGGVEAASHGHDVVMSPSEEVYFDFYQSNYNEPLGIAGVTTMQSVYNWSPMPPNLDAKFRNHILGAQANVWTEYMPYAEHVEYMIFPRLVALAEILWTEDSVQNFEDFTHRMNFHYNRLDALNLNYRIPYPEGLLPVDALTMANSKLALSVPIEASTIYYTKDGSCPKENGIKYQTPLMFSEGSDSPILFKCVTKMPNGRWSAVHNSKVFVGQPMEAQDVSVEKGVVCKLKIGEFSSAQFEIEKWDNTTVQDGIYVSKEAPNNFFAEQIVGYIRVPQTGIYTFTLTSGDGSILSINKREVIDNDGFSYSRYSEGRIALKAGLHSFTINHFEAKFGSTLQLTAIAPDGTKINFNAENVFH